jgi:hypothetical protein
MAADNAPFPAQNQATFLQPFLQMFEAKLVQSHAFAIRLPAVSRPCHGFLTCHPFA